MIFVSVAFQVSRGKSLPLSNQYSVSEHLILMEFIFLPFFSLLFNLFFVVLVSVLRVLSSENNFGPHIQFFVICKKFPNILFSFPEI